MDRNSSVDLVVLGGGAAAFAAITEATRQELSTAIINDGLPLGGTCVNVGCVPSKHLLKVGKTAFEPPRNPFSALHYDTNQPSHDWEAALSEKDRLVESIRQQNYTTVADRLDTAVYRGTGQFIDDSTIKITTGEDEGSIITGSKALIATGSAPSIPRIAGIESVNYETTRSILTRETLPESLVMIGGGFAGTEWGQLLHRFGVDVTILQRSPHLLSDLDAQLGRTLQDTFEAEGIQVVTDVEITRITNDPEEDSTTSSGSASVNIELTRNGIAGMVTANTLFLATGVTPNTSNIGLDEIGIETDETGAIIVDETLETTNQVVYAAGDCVGGSMLETVAAKEGNLAVKNAFSHGAVEIDYGAVPSVIYTSPEVATVGVTEDEYRATHGTCSCRTVQMTDVPKAKAVMDTRGFVQVVADHVTDEIVGVHMVGPRAADMITEATIAVKYGLTIDDIIDTIHPFPTFSEALKMACQAFRRDISLMSCCVE